MKTSLVTTTFFIAFASTSALAQPPAADISGAEAYSSIDKNMNDARHGDMAMENMEHGIETMERSMEEHRNEEGAGSMEEFRYTEQHRHMDKVGSENDTAATHIGGRENNNTAGDADEDVDTIVLYDDAVNVLTE